jgi:hypothetical protein
MTEIAAAAVTVMTLLNMVLSKGFVVRFILDLARTLGARGVGACDGRHAADHGCV